MRGITRRPLTVEWKVNRPGSSETGVNRVYCTKDVKSKRGASDSVGWYFLKPDWRADISEFLGVNHGNSGGCDPKILRWKVVGSSLDIIISYNVQELR